MISKTTKAHWRLAIKMLKKAIKVTKQDIIQQIKAINYHYKILDDLERKRNYEFFMENFYEYEEERSNNEIV